MRRILAIDGGGIKGVFPAAFLASLEEQIGENPADYFDLIVGTSTGGIIALGLGLGYRPTEILEFYEKKGPEIFGGSRLLRTLRHIFVSKYSNAPLRKALEEYFGDRLLGESTIRLVIPSLDLDTGKVHVFKTAHHARLEVDYGERVVDVALATAAAPTYFPTHKLAAGTPLTDGGMWANNPAGVAVVEAVGVLGWNRNDLRVLSLGCTESPLEVRPTWLVPLGLTYWAQKLVDVFMAGQSSASIGTAQLLAGRGNVIRVCPSVPAGKFRLDDVRSISSLKGLGSVEARNSLPELRSIFFDTPAEKFTPLYRLDERDPSPSSMRV